MDLRHQLVVVVGGGGSLEVAFNRRCRLAPNSSPSKARLNLMSQSYDFESAPYRKCHPP
jgi:hypothetical protein